ncbi:MAG: multidrug ABC transporter permease [Candidatus Terraquivivens tikiterensis]|uniref:Multidrug ABC transporter permease n=1 Tax=Candidatus Terraquivivens tikiterensis TaxID=1980982 RepID=A0A2R7YBB0_9ARCH|nr:MAG: multidrug ABC transporter permease [Candidatus Terraquivivens tikiterensis]
MEGLKNMLVMIELELRRLRHDRTEIYFRAVQPILWILIYGPVMSSVRAIPTGGVPYTDFITPGVMIQTTTFVSIFYGLMMVWERESGILKKLLVTPASRYSMVIGRSMASGVRALFQALIILPIALIIGVRFIPNPAYFSLAFTIIFFASGGFAAISILVASFMKTRERFMGIGQAIIMPLFFASNALYPVQMMPPILREFSTFNPLSYVVDAVRGLLITGDLSNLLMDLVAIAIFDAVSFILASISFKRIIE